MLKYFFSSKNGVLSPIYLGVTCKPYIFICVLLNKLQNLDTSRNNCYKLLLILFTIYKIKPVIFLYNTHYKLAIVETTRLLLHKLLITLNKKNDMVIDINPLMTFSKIVLVAYIQQSHEKDI